MTVYEFKFQVKILGNSDKLEVTEIRKLIKQVYVQLVKKPNSKMFDAVKEVEDYLEAKIEFEEYIESFK